MDLTEVDCIAIEEALSTLMTYIQGNVPNLRHTSGDVVMQNLLAITSPDHNFALDAQKTCNRLLRYFATLFAKDGIDIRREFDS